LHVDESDRELSTALSLSVTSAEGISNEGQPLTFFAHDIQKLRSLVADYKRLKQIAGTLPGSNASIFASYPDACLYLDSEIDSSTVINLAQSTTHFRWLKPYLAKQSTIASRKSHFDL
jgi:phosphatidylinositol-bisphosphatase